MLRLEDEHRLDHGAALIPRTATTTPGIPPICWNSCSISGIWGVDHKKTSFPASHRTSINLWTHSNTVVCDTPNISEISHRYSVSLNTTEWGTKIFLDPNKGWYLKAPHHKPSVLSPRCRQKISLWGEGAWRIPSHSCCSEHLPGLPALDGVPYKRNTKLVYSWKY